MQLLDSSLVFLLWKQEKKNKTQILARKYLINNSLKASIQTEFKEKGKKASVLLSILFLMTPHKLMAVYVPEEQFHISVKTFNHNGFLSYLARYYNFL